MSLETAGRFGQRVRDLRKGRRLSLQQVAAAVGRSTSWLSQVERGLRWCGEPPPYGDLLRLAKALDVPIGNLLADDLGIGAPLAVNHIYPFNDASEQHNNLTILSEREHAMIERYERSLLMIRRYPVPVVSMEALSRGEIGPQYEHEILEVPAELLDKPRPIAAISAADNACAPWALAGDYLLIAHDREACATAAPGTLIVAATARGVRISRVAPGATLSPLTIGVYINTYTPNRCLDAGSPSSAKERRRGAGRLNAKGTTR